MVRAFYSITNFFLLGCRLSQSSPGLPVSAGRSSTPFGSPESDLFSSRTAFEDLACRRLRTADLSIDISIISMASHLSNVDIECRSGFGLFQQHVFITTTHPEMGAEAR